MRGFRSFVLVGVASLWLAIGAQAASSAAGGKIELFVTPKSLNNAVFKIVIVGAIGDYGTATSIDRNGKVDSNGNYVRIRLTKGGFEINSVALNKKTNSAPPLLESQATCSVVFGGSGPVTVFNGTGAYSGIGGTLHITETFAAIGPRLKTGAKKGQCNTSNSARPVALWAAITGSGTVKFS